MNIVVLDGHAANPGDLSWEPFREFGSLTVYPRTPLEQLFERAKDADIILTNKIPFSREIIAGLPRLKFIGILATGFNTIDIAAAREHGVIVANIPSYSTDSVAQMVFALVLNVCNRTDHYAVATRSGRWSQNPDFCYWDTPLTELAGKTFGIYGLGNIGMRVAGIAQAFGMRVIAVTSKPQSLLGKIEKVSFEELLSQSDVLSLHCPLTAETKALINSDSLTQMKPSAILVNTGRGPLVDEQAVAAALRQNCLQAYVADVMEQEPPAADNPLLDLPNAYLTPHIAWATYEARQRLMAIAVENVRSFVQGSPVNVVNP